MNRIHKFLSLTAIVAMALTTSCRDEEALSSAEANDIVEDAVLDAYFEDVDDLSTVAVTDNQVPQGGRVSSVNGDTITVRDDHKRLDCAKVELVITSTDPPAGIITIDFGDSCRDASGNWRSGIIKITFENRWFMPGATRMIELIDFSINGIQLEGTRLWENLTESKEDSPTTRITLTGGKATWPDGTFATREHVFVRTWIRKDDPLMDELHVDGEASGSTRRGNEYKMNILETLVYKRECVITEGIRMAVDGVKQFTMNGKTMTINFGDGECDRIITITVNGEVRNAAVGS